MMTKLRIVLVTGTTLLPSFAYAEGQDWMRSVNNIEYFFELLIIYCIATFVTYWTIRKFLKRKMKIVFFLFAALSVTIIHWEITKERPMTGPMEKYLNSKDIDTTPIKQFKDSN